MYKTNLNNDIAMTLLPRTLSLSFFLNDTTEGDDLSELSRPFQILTDL